MPRLGVAATYTDNIRLATRGSEQSDFVTQLTPELSVIANSRRMNGRLDYAMENLSYARAKGDLTTNHQLAAIAQGELVSRLFFVDARASISQQAVSPFGPQSLDSLSLTDNRTDVRTLSVSPYFRHSFGQEAAGEVRFRRSMVDTDTKGLVADRTDQYILALQSGPSFKTIGWGVNYSHQDLSYPGSGPIEFETVSTDVRYKLSPKVGLLGTIGHERNTYVSIAEKPEGAFWLAGVSWTPSARTYLQAQAGNRFFGRTYALTSSHRTRRSVWSLSYNEEISSTAAQFTVPASISTADFLNSLWKTSIPDEQARQQVVDTFIRDTGLPPTLSQQVNTITNRVFLQKNLQASLALSHSKSTLVVTLFHTTREAQSEVQADSSLTSSAAMGTDVRQRGGSAMWNWRISPRTSANISASYSGARSLTTARKDKHRDVRIALVNQMRPKLRAALELRRQFQESNQVARDVRETAVTASILASF